MQALSLIPETLYTVCTYNVQYLIVVYIVQLEFLITLSTLPEQMDL